jgi:hypothetical protein
MKNRHQQQGVALIITLILLSVTLIMAVAFLAISRRESGSVTTSTDTTTARLAADSALAHAEAQIIAGVLSTTNPYNYGLLVSTNYINANGFVSGIVDPTNVNYVYGNGNPLNNTADFLQNVGNLFYLPRAPVFVPTNSLGSNEFRFYLDLNRNGQFEDSGLITNLDNTGAGLGSASPQVGDPQWIGVLERPDTTHGPNNKFISRYAFIAVPADSLDLNYIHNQVFDEANANPTVSPNSSDAFFRNQGVGSWEINLAAFLADLNSDEWGQVIGNSANGNTTYYYYQNVSGVNRGSAFNDADALLAYRYANNYNTLASVQNLFGANAVAFQNNIDDYSDGPLMTTPASITENGRNVNFSWAGADNTNHFFNEPDDLFDPTKSSPFFVDRLLDAGTNTFPASGGNTVATSDRYTFYRLLAQLGTDTSAESGKMNLNYDNLDPGINGVLNVNGTTSVTNFVPWTPIGFFTNAVDRMLRAYTTNWFISNPSNYLATYYATNYPFPITIDGFGNVTGLTNAPFSGILNTIPAFGITNIPVFVNGQFVYSSAVNRILQLAANIYDASTNRFYDGSGFPLPTLFEPVFFKVANGTSWNVYITNFVEYVGTGATLANTFPLDLSNPNDLARVQPFSLISGVPIIVGVKKGLPNFNEFTMASSFQITRKLQLTRASTNLDTDPPSTFKINQMFNCSIANLLSMECWNSYFTNYIRPTTIFVADHIQMTLTNDQPNTQPPAQVWATLDAILSNSIAVVNPWPGIGANMNARSFVTTNLTAIALPTATYIFNSPLFNGFHFNPIGTNTPTFEVLGGSPPLLPQPHWWLLTTNNLQVVMIDNATGRAIDYVQLRGPNTTRDLTAEILSLPNNQNPPVMWNTNFVSSGILTGVTLPAGVENQLQDSSASFVNTASTIWTGQSQGSVQPQIDAFNRFIGQLHDTNLYGATNLEIQAPYTPTATTILFTMLQANDPLVHYMASDLFDTANGSILTINLTNIAANVLSERYQPWGVSKQMAARITPDVSPWNTALKDPLIWSSDHWDFPTNKFPTVGWLGRVHRGTPWQTVYLKATDVLPADKIVTWTNWTGNINAFDASNAAPVQDRLLFDLFTTAPNDNATHGQISVNMGINGRPSLAAWSAALSGVTVLANNMTNDIQLRTFHTLNSLQTIPSFTTFPINPAGINGVNSSLGKLAAGINNIRAAVTNADGLTNVFEHVGDILSVPQFTEQSPFLLNLSDTNQLQYGISDEMYEWLPQQMMSLLRDSSAPRYVIYSYGQTLKPAPNGIVTSGGQNFFGMVTNYQIVAETATRAVVRVDDAKTTHPHVVIESFNLLPPD